MVIVGTFTLAVGFYVANALAPLFTAAAQSSGGGTSAGSSRGCLTGSVQGRSYSGASSDKGASGRSHTTSPLCFSTIRPVSVVKPIVTFFTLPLYVITLGLFSFVVNALMLQATSWISEATPLTFRVDDFFWSAVLGAVVVTFVSLVLNLVLPDGKDD